MQIYTPPESSDVTGYYSVWQYVWRAKSGFVTVKQLK